MKYVLTMLVLLIVACGNKVEVPSQIETKVNVSPVTGEITVRHIIQIELPTVLSDDCKNKYPNDETAYNACVSEYIKYLISIINQVPPVGL